MIGLRIRKYLLDELGEGLTGTDLDESGNPRLAHIAYRLLPENRMIYLFLHELPHVLAVLFRRAVRVYGSLEHADILANEEFSELVRRLVHERSVESAADSERNDSAARRGEVRLGFFELIGESGDRDLPGQL